MIRGPYRLLAAMLAAMCLLEPLLWLWGSHALAAGFDRWAARLRADGWTVDVKGRASGGFPFAAMLVLTDVRVAGGAKSLPGGLSWRGYRVVLSVSLAAPATLVIAPEEQEFVRLANLPQIIFHADRMEARLKLLDGGTREARLSAQGVTAGISGSHHPQDVRVDEVSAKLTWRDADRSRVDGTLVVQAGQIGLPDIGRWPLGALIGTVGATLDVHAPALSGHEPAAVAAANWQRDGGRLALRDGLMKWGPLTLTGEAELGLDNRLQPAGKGVANVAGGAAAFDALVSGGVLPQGVGATAKVVLGAMAPLPGGDAVRLPFVLRNNTLSVGPIPITRLNDVVW